MVLNSWAEGEHTWVRVLGASRAVKAYQGSINFKTEERWRAGASDNVKTFIPIVFAIVFEVAYRVAPSSTPARIRAMLLGSRHRSSALAVADATVRSKQ